MITIDLLKNHPETIPELASLWVELLGKQWMPDLSIEYIEHLMHSWSNEDNLPLAHIALDGAKPVGVVSLQTDSGIRPDLTPWIGTLIIEPQYQRLGIGTSLINAIKEKARKLGFKHLYLFTFDQSLISYYARFGFTTIGTDEFHNHTVTILKTTL